MSRTGRSNRTWGETKQWLRDNPSKQAAIVTPEGAYVVTFEPIKLRTADRRYVNEAASKPSCGTCKFARPEHRDWLRECHRHAPVIRTSLGGPTGRFPLVAIENECGDYEKAGDR